MLGSRKEGEGQRKVPNRANLLIHPPMSAMGDTEEQEKYLLPFSEIMRLCGKSERIKPGSTYGQKLACSQIYSASPSPFAPQGELELVWQRSIIRAG